MSIKVVASNCGCCAIKHIRNIPNSPDQTWNASIDWEGHDEDQDTSEPPAYDSWLNEPDRKPENAGDAIRMIVQQIKERRPAGMITMNLVSGEEYCCCNGYRCSCDGEKRYEDSSVNSWDPFLRELGFTSVEFLNSNSGNRIHHYTLVYDEGNWDA